MDRFNPLRAFIGAVIGERRPSRKLIYTLDLRQVALPVGSLYQATPIRSLVIVDIKLLNIGSDPIVDVEVGILLGTDAVVTFSQSYPGPIVDQRAPRARSGRSEHLFGLDRINPDKVIALTLVCLNASAEDAQTSPIEQEGMSVERVDSRTFDTLRKRLYDVSKGPEAARTDTSPAAMELQRKRAAGTFDVFLCHNAKDKPAVQEVARRLMDRGILPWLDVWELPPGVPWQPELERQIANIKAAAVFVGGDGIGPWQQQEIDAFLREFVRRRSPVIPVMLPGASGELALPIFLRGISWVDFRAAAQDPVERLIWGITGKRP